MKRLLISICLAVCAYGGTTITDTIYTGFGTEKFNGRLVLTAPTMTTAAGSYVAQYVKRINVTDGDFSLQLEPNDTATPAGTHYTVTYFPTTGQQGRTEIWIVPTSGSALTISQVRVSSVPTPSVTFSLSQLSPVGASKGSLIAFGTSWGPLTVGTNGYALVADSTQPRGLRWSATAGGSSAWGGITGNIGDQTDLSSALSGKASASHVHAATDITSAIFDTARLGSGSASVSTYLRGDKVWSELPYSTGGGSPYYAYFGDTDTAITVLSANHRQGTKPVLLGPVCTYQDGSGTFAPIDISAPDTSGNFTITLSASPIGHGGGYCPIGGSGGLQSGLGATLQGGETLNLSAANLILPLNTADPVACETGQLLWRSDLPDGSNLKGCTSGGNPGTWTALGGSGGGGGGGPLVWNNITLQNGWANNPYSYQSMQYAKDSSGTVYIRGMAVPGTLSSGTTVFTLPVGYRPPTVFATTIQVGDNGFVRFDFYPNGSVQLVAPTGQNGFYSFERVFFNVN